MNNDIQIIIKILKDQQSFIAEKYGVKSLGVFGSTARGENNIGSDVDILVEFVRPISMFTFLELEEYLTRLLDKKVDLVSKKALKKTIEATILQEVSYV